MAGGDKKKSKGKKKNGKKRSRSSSRGSGGGDAPDDKSPKIEIRVLTPPNKAKHDTNEYKLIELPNGIKALLIRQDIKMQKVPEFHHRELSVLSYAEMTPSFKDPVSPLFNTLGFQMTSFGPNQPGKGRGQQSLSRRWSRLGLLVNHSFSTDEDWMDMDKGAFGVLKKEALGFGGENKGTDKNRVAAPSWDAAMSEASIALTVNFGAARDPPEYNGLAHFMEHMVFYCSEKYKEEDALLRLVLDKGFNANAFTQLISTTYNASISNKYFDQLLDILGNMMRKPIFKEEAVLREVNAVDNEFLLLEDSYAMAEIELFGELTKPGHPLSNFSCGNLKTLWHKNQDKNGKKLTQELSKSHKKYYVGSGMTLAIETSNSFESMEKMVIKHFSGISRGDRFLKKESKVPNSQLKPFDTNDFRKLWIVQGKQYPTFLKVTWSLPPSVWTDYKSKPIDFASVLISSMWEGGLGQELKRLGLSFYMTSGSIPAELHRNEFHTVFQISFVLSDVEKSGTPALESKIDDILSTTFCHLARLCVMSEGEMRAVWEELTLPTNLYFDYSGPGDQENLVVHMSRRLQLVPGEDLLTADNTNSEDFNYAKVMECLRYLTPRSMNVMAFMPEDWNGQMRGYSARTLPLTKAKCFSKAFSANRISKWANCGENVVARRVPANPFTELIRHGVRGMGAVEKQRLELNSRFVILHEGHPGGDLFQATCQAQIFSSIIKGNVQNYSKLVILKNCVEELLAPQWCEMERSGLTADIRMGSGIIFSNITGFHEKFPAALRAIIGTLTSKTIPEPSFQRAKINALKRMKKLYGKWEYLANQLFQELIVDGAPTFRNLEQAIANVDYESFETFLGNYCKSIFIGVIVEGNAHPEFCRERIGSALADLDFYPRNNRWRLLLSRPVTLFLPVENKTIRVKSDSRTNRNSLVTNYYQAGIDRKIDINEAMKFISRLMQGPVFLILRTEQQLGYIVGLQFVPDLLPTPMFMIYVVCPQYKKPLCEVDQAIDKFLIAFNDRFLLPLSEEEFEEQAKLWEIEETLKLEDLKSWYQETFMRHMQVVGSHSGKGSNVWWFGPARIAKLSIQVLGGETEKCSGQRNKYCNDSKWTKPQGEEDQPISFATDKFLHFISDPQKFKEEGF